MASYTIRSLPPGLIPRARARAKADATTLDAVLLRLIESYAEQGAPGSAGAKARSASMSNERRAEIARNAASARWNK